MITPILTALAGFFGSPAPVIQAPPTNAQHQSAATPQAQARPSGHTFAFHRLTGSFPIFPESRGLTPKEWYSSGLHAKLKKLRRLRRWRKETR